MARKNESAALAVAPQEDNALASIIEGMEFEVDGLEGADTTDIRTPTIIFNRKGTDESGRLRQLNEFIFTETNEYLREVRCVFVAFAKSNSFKVYDESKDKNEIVCSSHDQVQGRMRMKHPSLNVLEGTVRPCEKCPDMEWFTDAKGKKRRNCAEVANVLGATLTPELQLDREFTIRFSKTSLKPFMDHLNKHHFKKHPTVRGANLPLFVFEVVLTLEVDKGGNFARPVFTRGRPLARDTIAMLQQVAKDFHEAREEYVKKLDSDEAKHGDNDSMVETTGTGTGYRADDFADG